jgi:phosphoglycerate dehydrogenase-like enzyme
MTHTSVLFLWKVPEPLKRYLRENLRHIEGLKLLFPEKAEESEFLHLAPNAQIIVGWRPSEALLEAATNLHLFIFPGAGVQHLVEWFRTEGQNRNITLVNGHSNSVFVAQHVVALLLGLMNRIVQHHNWMVEGEWRKGDDDAKTLPLHGRTIGLLGYGAINQKVHQFLAGFDVNFAALRRGWETSGQSLPTPITQYTPSQLDDFLDEIDILIVAVPLTQATKGLIGKKELKRLGPQSLVVNVARGDVIDQSALYHALAKKVIAGAAIDVWYTYQPGADEKGRKYPYEHPFHILDNILLSPHRAASPFDDLDRWGEVVENITRFTQERTDFLNIVDVNRGY